MKPQLLKAAADGRANDMLEMIDEGADVDFNYGVRHNFACV